MFWIDCTFARLSNGIPIANATCGFSIDHTPLLTAFNLFTQVADKLLCNHSHHCNEHFVHFTMMNGEKLDAIEAQFFMQLRGYC
nr:hypothetical protein [Sulfitobacter undariae]